MILFTFDRRQSEEVRGSNEGESGMVRKVEYSVFLASRKNKNKYIHPKNVQTTTLVLISYASKVTLKILQAST